MKKLTAPVLPFGSVIVLNNVFKGTSKGLRFIFMHLETKVIDKTIE